MPATPIRPARLAPEPPTNHKPLLPVVVVASYKGGTGKTALSVALAERLAWAGLRVLLMTCDSQEDARHRLGIDGSERAAAQRHYGSRGSLTVVGLRGSQAVDVLYRTGPQSNGLQEFDLAVVDTPPEIRGGSLPGVTMIATVDGTDAARNLITMLRQTPTNTRVILVAIGEGDAREWIKNARAIEAAAGRELGCLGQPLPRSPQVKDAHDEGKSVWSLRRAGRTLAFLNGVETLARIAWELCNDDEELPTMPPSSSAVPYVPGWDDE